MGLRIYVKWWGVFATTPFYTSKITVKKQKKIQIGHKERGKVMKFGGHTHLKKIGVNL